MNRNKSNEPDTRAIRALFGKFSDRTHRETAVTVIADMIELARIQIGVEAPRAARIFRIRRRGPVAHVRARSGEDRVVADAGSRKEDALIGIITLACDK